MNRKRASWITISVLLSVLLIAIFLTDTIMAEETVSGTQDDTLGVWMFSAGTTVPAGAPTDNIIERAVFYNILDYIGDSAQEVYNFGYGPSEPVPGQEDKTLAEVIEGLSAIDDFGYLANAGDDAANFDTGRRGYFLGGFDPATVYKIYPDGKPAIGVLGPSGAPDKEKAEKALDGCELFIFEDAELSGMIITLSNKLGLSITITIADLQINPPTPTGADDTMIAIDLDTLAGFDGTFIDTIRIQDDGITSPSTYGDTTLELDAIAIRKSTEKPLTGSIGDTVWLDENRNGVQDGGERGISGVIVILKGLMSTTTRENGYYLFDNLTADTYTAQVIVPNGYEATTVTSYLIDLGIGEDYLDADFGIAPPLPAKLIVEKFNDTDGNGIFNTGIDEMLTGWKVDVMDPDGATASFFTPISLDITNFGTYTLTEDLPSDWEQTAVEVNGVYKDPPTLTVAVEINVGEEHSVLYGNRRTHEPHPAKLFIEKFNDTNRNGVFDGTDVMITGWKIYVTDPHGVTTTYLTPVDLEITEFGAYIVRENLPAGWEQTALFVDGVAKPPSVQVTVDINAGDERKVLYGNHKIPPKPTRIRFYLGLRPLGGIPVGRDVTFGWRIVEDPLGITVPQKVALYLVKDGGAPKILYTGSDFPKDFTGEFQWHADEAGNYEVKVRYDYLYLGKPYYASGTHGFTVVP